jgi:DNA helicase HerA-like ATPase
MRPGHISVVDVAGLQSGLAQQTFVQYVLHQVFRRANRIFLEARADEPYEGVVIFLDEAWRFFRTPNVLDELETISRMGRSLRVGLWLADQNIPTGEREWNVLNNFRTRIVGSISADRTILKRVMPLEETMLTVLPNLRRGMAIFFNQEYSRIPTPVIIPPCTCYHEGD